MRGLAATLLVVLAALSGITGMAAAAERKVALVIGNGEYQHAAKLRNPAHDAAAMAFMLKDAGFEVVESHLNLGAGELRRVIRLFGETARGADIALVYYAGHGIELDGVNYLIPSDARLAADLDVEDEAIALERILSVLEPARRLRLVILDACRDNPFLTGIKRLSAARSIGRGLARVEPVTSDTLVAFAAKAGSVAADGNASNSPFTAALLKHLPTPGLDVRLALGRVRDEVLARTDRRQEPFVYGSLGGDLVALTAGPGQAAADAARPQADAEALARRDYELAERVGAREAWDLYLARHPSGFFADLARAQRARLAGRSEPMAPDAKVAALPPADAGPSAKPSPAADPASIARDLKRELRRVGCDPGDGGDAWSVDARRALDRFNSHAGTRFDVRIASIDALEAVRHKGVRVCPLACPPGHRAQDDQCVRTACGSGATRGADGRCRPRAQPKAAAAPLPGTAPLGGEIVRCGRRGCRTFTNLKHADCWSAARGLGAPGSPERRAAIAACMRR